MINNNIIKLKIVYDMDSMIVRKRVDILSPPHVNSRPNRFLTYIDLISHR